MLEPFRAPSQILE